MLLLLLNLFLSNLLLRKNTCMQESEPQWWSAPALTPLSEPPVFPFPALTLLPHASLLALAQPAELALAPHKGVHLAGSTAPTGIAPGSTMDYAAPEEAFAALTTEYIVVEARGLVPTHAAQLVTQHLRGRTLLSLALGLILWL